MNKDRGVLKSFWNLYYILIHIDIITYVQPSCVIMVHSCTCTCICKHTHTEKHTHACSHAHTHITHTHTHTQARTHTHTHNFYFILNIFEYWTLNLPSGLVMVKNNNIFVYIPQISENYSEEIQIFSIISCCF